jgi:hypothetical protein
MQIIEEIKVTEISLMPDGSYEMGYQISKEKAMIQANELRVGNYVYDFSGKPVVVVRTTFGATPLETPIPLTPEILEKCGFEEINIIHVDERPYDGSIGDYQIKQFKSRMKNGYYLSHQTKLLYLHQLQNLYFALTGEELTVNLLP